jgi:outer membrane protein
MRGAAWKAVLAAAALAGLMRTAPCAAGPAPSPPATAQQAPGVPATPAPPAPNVVETPVPPPVAMPAPPSPPPDMPNRPLTADEAARIALARQPSITVARTGVKAAEGVTQQTRSGLLPTIGVSTGYTHVERLSGQSGAGGTAGGSPGGATGFDAAAVLRQLVYDFNHTRDLVRESRAQEIAATHNLSRAQADVVLAVKQAFYQFVQNQRLVTVNDENVANRQAQLDLANARLKVGLGLASDVVTAQTALSEAVQNLTVARNNASAAQVNLALLMGIDPRTPIQPAESGEPPMPSDDVNGFVRTALGRRPEILQAQATLQANEHALRAARTTNAPAVTTNLGFSGVGDQLFPRNDTLSIGVALQFNPFDGGLTAGRVKQARSNLESAQAQLLNEQLTVTSDVSQAYRDVRSAEQRTAAAGTEVINAREGVRIATGRYRAGLGQFLDVLNAQQFLYTALSNHVMAQAALEQARAAFSHAIGSPTTGAR